MKTQDQTTIPVWCKANNYRAKILGIYSYHYSFLHLVLVVQGLVTSDRRYVETNCSNPINPNLDYLPVVGDHIIVNYRVRMDGTFFLVCDGLDVDA